MSPGHVRHFAAVLTVVLTTGCGALLEERRPDETITRLQSPRESGDFFVPRKPRVAPGPELSGTALKDTMEWVLKDVQIERLRAEWRGIVSDDRFHPLHVDGTRHTYSLMLAAWSFKGSAPVEITRGYQQWCNF